MAATAQRRTSPLDDVPRPSPEAFRLIRTACDPDVSLQRLAKALTENRDFGAFFMSFAASRFGAGRELGTPQRAAVSLGARPIRAMAAAWCVLEVSKRLRTGGFEQHTFWENSLRRAVAARILAAEAGYDVPAEAFAVGLLQDAGMLIMPAIWPEHAEDLQAVMGLPAKVRLDEEHRLTQTTHTALLRAVAPRWGLPDDLVEVIAGHHSGSSSSMDRRVRRLTEIAAAADAVADVFQAEGMGETVTVARTALVELPSRSELSLDVIGQRLERAMPEASAVTGISVRSTVTYEQLVAASPDRVQDDYHYLVKQLRKLQRERDELRRNLQRAQAELKRLALADTLTGCATRRAFTMALMDALKDVRKVNSPVSVVIVDIDGLRSINDRLGLVIGDELLAEVGKRLSVVVRPTDLVGRIDGGQFALLLRETAGDGGSIAARRVLHGLNREPVTALDGTRLTVTASLGGATALPGRALPSVDAMLAQAESAVRLAKESGRNCVRWHIPAP